MRASCHSCSFRGERNSDFTIYDLWGIKNIASSLYDTKGVSGININSNKGRALFGKIKNNLNCIQLKYDEVIKFNPRFLTSGNPHPNREQFFKRYKNEELNKLIPELLNEKPLIIKIFQKLLKKLFKY